MKRKGFITATILVFVLGLAMNAAAQTGAAGTSGTSGAASLPSGQRFEIKPYIYASEQYTSNVYLTKDNQKSDWITTLGPGIRLAVNDPSFGADLTGNFGYNWYANKTKNDYWSIDGNLGMRWNPTPQLTLRVTDYILRSENSVEPNYPQGGQPAQPGNLVGVNRGNAPYLRNVVTPSVDWQFSRQGNVGIAYSNNILNYDDSTQQNSMQNTVSPYVNYWFDQRNNIALDYSFTSGSYSGGPFGVNSPGYTSQNAHGRYTYRFDAQMSVFADYTYLYQNTDSPGISYNTNTPSAGIIYNFNPTLTLFAQGGWYWMSPDRGAGQDSLFGNVSLTQRERQTTYTLAFNAGYQQNQDSAAAIGFYKYYQGTASVTHSLTQRFNIGFVGTARYVDYAFYSRNDWIYTADATAGYQILKWLTVSGRAGYQGDSSSISAGSYDEWHAFLTLSATFDNLY